MNLYDQIIILANANKTFKVAYYETLENCWAIQDNVQTLDEAFAIKEAYCSGYIKGQNSRVINELTIALMLEQSDSFDKTLVDCYRAATYYYRSEKAIKLAGDTVYAFLTKVSEAMKAMYEYSYTPDDFMDILGVCYPEEKDLLANAENLYKKLTIEFIKEED